MEKGWTSKFSVINDVKEEKKEVEISEDEGVGADEDLETTHPETGLNMWFVYDKVEDIETFLAVSGGLLGCRLLR